MIRPYTAGPHSIEWPSVLAERCLQMKFHEDEMIDSHEKQTHFSTLLLLFLQDRQEPHQDIAVTTALTPVPKLV